MTLPASGPISFTDVNNEIGYSPTYSTDLSFLNSLILPSQRPGPSMSGFYGLTYFQNNNAGNCDSGNCNCSSNCGNVNCNQCQNAGTVNCANCDAQKWLQTNCNCACTYNCNWQQTSYACRCTCACGKIICTKLHELGLLNSEIFKLDQEYGAWLQQNQPDVYDGYIAWAQVVVDWMNGGGPKIMFWMNDEKFKQAIKSWSISWAKDIATPWAEQIAGKTSVAGKLLFYTGLPICKLIGMYRKVFGKGKKAGFTKGMILVIMFTIFKLVVEFGRLIDKRIENVRYS